MCAQQIIVPKERFEFVHNKVTLAADEWNEHNMRQSRRSMNIFDPDILTLTFRSNVISIFFVIYTR